MNSKRIFSTALTPLILGAALASTFSGCVGYVDSPRVGYHSEVIVEDDYDYYPGYEVYYSRSRHQYAYQDNGRWVYRSSPRNVSVSVLLASPSVRAGFRDSPERHHATMVRQYPRNWKPNSRVQTHESHSRNDDKRKPETRNSDNRSNNRNRK